MTMRMRMIAAVAVAAAAALSGPLAGAHDDPNPDGNNTSATRCDTYWRGEGHQSGTGNNTTSHHHEHEFDNGEVAPGVYLHNHTGHYVVRHDAFYVEVVGGGGYSRDGNQGGYVQGEVDPVEGAPDVDFHTNTFAGPNSPMDLPAHADGAACVSVADNKIGDEGDRP